MKFLIQIGIHFFEIYIFILCCRYAQRLLDKRLECFDAMQEGLYDSYSITIGMLMLVVLVVRVCYGHAIDIISDLRFVDHCNLFLFVC